jgi:hypothetical protein
MKSAKTKSWSQIILRYKLYVLCFFLYQYFIPLYLEETSENLYFVATLQQICYKNEISSVLMWYVL